MLVKGAQERTGVERTVCGSSSGIGQVLNAVVGEGREGKSVCADGQVTKPQQTFGSRLNKEHVTVATATRERAWISRIKIADDYQLRLSR